MFVPSGVDPVKIFALGTTAINVADYIFDLVVRCGNIVLHMVCLLSFSVLRCEFLFPGLSSTRYREGLEHFLLSSWNNDMGCWVCVLLPLVQW